MHMRRIQTEYSIWKIECKSNIFSSLKLEVQKSLPRFPF